MKITILKIRISRANFVIKVVNLKGFKGIKKILSNEKYLRH